VTETPETPDETTPEEPVAADVEEATPEEPVAAAVDETTPAIPEEPVEADVAGDAGEASGHRRPPDGGRIDVAEDERPAPPARAHDPEPVGEGVPGTTPIGRGEPETPMEEIMEDTPRVRPEIPGADLIPDIVLAGEEGAYSEDEDADQTGAERSEPGEEAEEDAGPIATQIDLAAGARYPSKGYIAGKRKSAVARVYLRPGEGAYAVNGRTLDAYFPRQTLQRTIRQPLESVGYESRMDVVAKIHGGGVSAQADALRHGVARALLDADPNLRGELKRRGFLTRDSRVKERKKAGLKKARKKPQFSKR